MPPKNDTGDVVRMVSKWPPIIQLALIVMLASGGGGAISNGLLFGSAKSKEEIHLEVHAIQKRQAAVEDEITEIKKLLQEIQLEVRDLKRRLEAKGVMYRPQAGVDGSVVEQLAERKK